jgi:hypothetical protein
MHPRLSRRGLLLGGSIALTIVIAACSFGSVVRAMARAEAARRHVDIDIRSVRPGWFAARLIGVAVRPEGVSGMRVAIEEVRVDLSLGFRPTCVGLRGVVIEANGSAATLRRDLTTWRALRANRAGSTRESSKHPETITVDGLALRWKDDDSPQPRAEFDGVSAVSDGKGTRLRAARVLARSASSEISLGDATAELDPAGLVIRAHGASLVVSVNRAAEGLPIERSTQVVPGNAIEPTKAADPAVPLVSLPDLRAVREKVASATAFLAERVREGTDIGVDALTWRIARANEQVPFTLGPGPLTLTRSSAGFELRFLTDPHAASTPLSIRAVLPAQGDAAVSLEGGPVSLALLGIQEGAAGLVDVGHASMTGRAQVVLADDGSAMTFDGEAGTRGLSLSNARLALDVVRGLDLQIHARGAATAEGQLRIDDLSASFGAIHITAGGVLEQPSDHVAAAFHFEVPTASCQSLLDSLPSALLPALQGTRMAGNFGARGRFGFDSRSLDDIQLEYDIKDQCHVTQVPRELARERFEKSFSHRIYLPDGSIAEETTGPGTDNWTPLDEISPYMQVAVLTTEDGAFPRHHGFNRASIRSSIVANLKARRFARGASTITMQLAKNLFLSRDKTLSRKLEEVVLTDYLEQTFSKDELMELYLNVIEFGPAVYGITAAAEYYFGRTPAELHLGECLFLSSLLPAPLRYGTMRESGQVPEGWMRNLRTLMQVAHRYGRITDAELAEAKAEPIVFWRGGERPSPRPPVLVRQGFDGAAGDVNTTPLPGAPGGGP